MYISVYIYVYIVYVQALRRDETVDKGHYERSEFKGEGHEEVTQLCQLGIKRGGDFPKDLPRL